MAISREDAQKQLQQIKEKALYIKGIVDERAAAEKKTSSSRTSSSSRVTSDSSGAKRDEDALRKEISDNLKKLERDQQRQIQRERDALELRKQEERASINTDFDQNREQREFEQSRETGQLATNLAAAGGFLGVTASQSGVQQNLAQVQKRDIDALENSRQEALRAADGAYQDRDFELARESLQLARDIEQEIYNRTLEYDNLTRQQADLDMERTTTTQQQQDIYDAIQTSGSQDPMTIFGALNGSVPIEAINSFLNNVVPDAAVGDGYKFSGSETGALIGAGMSKDDIIAFNQAINEEGYTDAIRALLTPAQRAAADKIFRDIKTTTGKDSPEAPLSILDLQRIEETYGVLFPLGVTAGEVTKFLRDNAGASAAEMQEAVNLIFGNVEEQNQINQATEDSRIEVTEEWLRENLDRGQLKNLADLVGASKWWSYKTYDIDRMFEKEEFLPILQQRVDQLRTQGFSDADILIALTQ